MRIRGRVIVLAFVALVIAAALIRATVRGPATPQIVPGPIQALQRPKEAWLFVETEQVKWRNRSASPPYVRAVHTQHVFVIDEEGLQQSVEIQEPSGVSFNRNLSRIVEFGNRVYLVEPGSAQQEPRVLIWSKDRFADIKSAEEMALVREHLREEERQRDGLRSLQQEEGLPRSAPVLAREQDFACVSFRACGGSVCVRGYSDERGAKLWAESTQGARPWKQVLLNISGTTGCVSPASCTREEGDLSAAK